MICTHFKAANIITSQFPNLPVHMVITDYDIHNFWINRNVKQYYVATSEAKHLLSRGGISSKKIQVTGIPVKPNFSRSQSPEKIREIYGIPRNKIASFYNEVPNSKKKTLSRGIEGKG